MIKYFGVCQDLAGNALAGATAQIKNFLTGVNAPIYEDDGVTPKANPITCDSSGRFSFKIAAGKYDIVTVSGAYTATESEVTILEDTLVAYFVNNHGSSLAFGDLVRITGSGQVQKAVSNSTEAAAGVEAICLESVLANGSTGRFRLLGQLDLAGTAGSYGYLSATGTVTMTIPSSGAGDTYLCIVGKFLSNTVFNFKPGYPVGIF
jgi:hypothetical protein